MRNTAHLIPGHARELENQIRKTRAGMAFWAGTGPFGATCGDCVFLGYWRQRRSAAGDIVATEHAGACKKFYELTHKHGPIVATGCEACKYFQRRVS